MKILSAAEMAGADRRSVEAGVAISELMQAAGEAVARFCLRAYPLAARAMVICGKGNNGGDGFRCAQVLAGEGVGVRVLLLGRAADVKGDAAESLRRLREATDDAIVEELEGDGDVDELAALFSEADLLIDAVVGTGFKPPLRGAAVTVREALAAVALPVVAVDLPSGWDADSTEETVEGAFRADAVVTFTAPKLAHVFGHLTPGGFGPVVVAPIGTPESAIESAANLHWSPAAKAVTEAARPINSNKGKFGHVLVIGGSYGTAGAPSMASLAALRTGAGLVTAAVPAAIANTVARIAPELMLRSLWQPEVDARDRAYGTASLDNLQPDRLRELLQGIKVIAIGPGLSTRGDSSEFVRQFVQKTDEEGLGKLPIVIDADGLNAFDAERAADLQGKGRTIVLTPHPGEMARLLGVTVKDVEADPVEIAQRFASEHGVTLVLKGWRTLIAHPDGRVGVNTSGNPALAKGGSGDILTGIIAACLAQWPDKVSEAVEAAVYLHGLAADFAAQTMNEKTVLATDVLDHLSDAFRYRTEDEDGFEWIAGLRPPRRSSPQEP